MPDSDSPFRQTAELVTGTFTVDRDKTYFLPPGATIEVIGPGQPCDHPGCLNHLTHPCEGCGRIGGASSTMTMSTQPEGMHVEFRGENGQDAVAQSFVIADREASDA